MSDSDLEDENFCFYGKALEPYDEDAVPKKKPIPMEDQIATDDHGRRRFHGAFTGGFSAGFYNTVGSLEGWRPSEFKSSRSEKALSKQSKPEDFMDDEDMGEHGFAPQTVKATSDYSTNRKRKKQAFTDGPIPGEPVLHTLISSGNETIGYLLMKNMDLKQRQKKPDEIDGEEPKLYGCIMPKTYEIKRSLESQNDVPNIYVYCLKNPKTNTFGIGYVGLNKSDLNFSKSTQLIVKDKDNKKLSISGQAFGVGAFENEDEDIYAKDDMSQYDFELTKEKKAIVHEKKTPTIFDNFIMSKTPLIPAQRFQPPSIPHSFTGKHKVKKSRFEPLAEEKIERKNMSAVIRARYIGEDIDDPQPCSSQQVSKSTLPSTNKSNDISATVVKEEPELEESDRSLSSNLLLDKFVSASEVENPHNILEEVKRTKSEHGTQEMRDAAKLKMYGPLTRIVLDWQPCSMLCRRFNVREPLSDDKLKKNERKKNHIIFEYQKNNEENVALVPGLKINKQEAAIPTPVDHTLDEIPMPVDKSAATPTTTIEEVPAKEMTINESTNIPLDITDKIDVSKNIDLFKAVFASSSESESENEEEKEEEEKSRGDMMKENVLNDYLIPKIKSNKEGILSHIKFNPLFRTKNTEPSDTEEKKSDQETEGNGKPPDSKKVGEMEVERDPNLYGPALPAQKIQVTTNTYLPTIVLDDEWVEKDNVEKKKSHKHKKKHKKEKHKKEHKSKHNR